MSESIMEQTEVDEQIKNFKIEMRRYRIPILKLSKDIGYPAALVSDILFLRKKPDIKLLQKIEESLNGSIQDKGEERYLNGKGRISTLPMETMNKSYQSLSCANSDILNKLGGKIKTIRTQLNLSEVEFGAELTPVVSPRFIREIEDNRFVPSLEHLIEIADLGKVTLDWLLRV
ncbi:helix-turn-helix domain-containing protein [Lactococcus allomyrinae]|uniref:XRE family transcriptional regulator n=1 Tax=Lactococcus allomyrinae TaxID=2419773 RepID=A0A387BPA4_9LACT|nr:helix-turn-helix transcriptional regulator [Lactococcus allomyrinae]AYG00361.1 XRE family transcriptional regulator [Lactococcus allomyrinae]